MKLTLLFSLALVAALPLAAQNADKWDYSGKGGPENWAKLSPDYAACGGKQQSPIDIRSARINKALKPIDFHYSAGPMTVLNTGKGIDVTVAPGSYILLNGTRYDLVSIDFHRPSEVTVKNKLSDMGVNLIHKSADGKLLGITVRLNEGNPNALAATITEHLPAKPGAKDEIKDLINPASILPANRAYWTYTGSLTRPPCTEGVQWFVFEDEKEISRDQLKAFVALYKFNARRLENPHGRKIEAFE